MIPMVKVTGCILELLPTQFQKKFFKCTAELAKLSLSIFYGSHGELLNKRESFSNSAVSGAS